MITNEIQDIQELEGNTRIQELSDGSRAYYVNVGEMPYSEVHTYMQGIVKTMKREGMNDIFIPFRPKDTIIRHEPPEWVRNNLIAMWLCIVALVLLSF